MQVNGVVTRDNNSVSIANIALHHIILQVKTSLKTSTIFKRYIDDNIFFQTRTATDNIKDNFEFVFGRYDLKLTLREISYPN